MIKMEDPSILEESTRDEYDSPLPQKVHPHKNNDHIIYVSRNNFGQICRMTGIIQIMDSDISVRGKRPHNGSIQAEVYRAPEVIWMLGIRIVPIYWAWELGVYCLFCLFLFLLQVEGVLIIRAWRWQWWDIFEGHPLFRDIHRVRHEDAQVVTGGTKYSKGVAVRSLALCWVWWVDRFFGKRGERESVLRTKQKSNGDYVCISENTSKCNDITLPYPILYLNWNKHKQRNERIPPTC